ncbi:MAG: carboxypeptidase-like regulatory domain-containing protein [Imperialibacter sp.]|uniref:carboxypeptidase-like regulatory domain-containing protein n=1 Tax=Imperialibacter sp. TaxID=2038411 RepID=UPI0032EBA724
MRILPAACILVFFVADVCAQAISGKVVDATTSQPLPFANVYINNSTIGTTTSQLGTFTLQTTGAANIELITSYVGYVSNRQTLAIVDGNIQDLVIRLEPSGEYLGEVEVVAKKDKAWDAMYNRFEKAFLGSTANASHSKILNPWVIDLRAEGSMIYANAKAPVEIENKALGYKVNFDLKEFAVSDSSFRILGYSFFSELEPERKSDPRRWKKTREQAYDRSIQHLLLAIIDNATKKNGLELYKQLPGTMNMQKTQWFYEEELGQRVVVIEPEQLNIQKTNGMVSMQLPEMLEVHFNRISARKRVYRDVPFEISWIVPNTSRVLINKNGLPTDPNSISVYGYLASLRVADLMPINYQP